MKKLAAVSLMITMLAVALLVNARPLVADIPAPPIIGATIADFTLPDPSGTAHTLASLHGKNGTVLIFIATQCPVSNGYNERMEKLAQDFKARGINVVGINANSTESAADVKDHAAKNNLTFTILKDNGNKVADMLGATRTPEAYFLDAGNKLLYHGRIDNSRDITQVNSSELRDALEATLAGKPVPKATANAFGCSIKRGAE
ncbi:MAG TPA: thioredoxin family protein [Pyrinomonadaceae bacterium]|nr:thioredoxin family protein [Pyrinomonadaceae bacterium]